MSKSIEDARAFIEKVPEVKQHENLVQWLMNLEERVAAVESRPKQQQPDPAAPV